MTRAPGLRPGPPKNLNPRTGAPPVPIYHLSLKPISRSAGRASTAAAAYRSAALIVDERTGQVFDFTRKQGVVHSQVVMPPGCNWSPSRSELWNSAELAERRKDACVAREHEVALPRELNDAQRLALAHAYAAELATRHGCAVDFALHAPRSDARGGEENWHAHFMCTTRKAGDQGLGEKCDRERAGRNRKEDLQAERQRWEKICNEHLEAAGLKVFIDCRSLADQGVADRSPAKHLGPTGAAIERKNRQPRRSEDLKKEVNARRQQRRTAQQVEAARAAEASARLRRRLTREPSRLYGGEGKSPSEFLRLDGLQFETRNGRTVWMFAKTGIAAVVDHGDSLSITRLSDSRVGAAIQIAKMKGWDSLVLTGSDEFIRKAARAALNAGLRIENPELQGLVKKIQSERSVENSPQQQRVSAADVHARPGTQQLSGAKAEAVPVMPESPAGLGRRAAEVDYLLAEQLKAAKHLRSQPRYSQVLNHEAALTRSLHEARRRQLEGVKDDPWLREVFAARATEKLVERREKMQQQESAARAALTKLETDTMLKRFLSSGERKRLAEKIEAARKASNEAALRVRKIEAACVAMSDPKTRAAYRSWAIQRMAERNENVEDLELRLAVAGSQRQALERRAGYDAANAEQLKEEHEAILAKAADLPPKDRERFDRCRLSPVAESPQAAASRNVLADALRLHEDAAAGRQLGNVSARDGAAALVARGATRAVGAQRLGDPAVGQYLTNQLERGDPEVCVLNNAARCQDKTASAVAAALKQAGVLVGDIQKIRQERHETKTDEGRYKRAKRQQEQARQEFDRKMGKTRFDEFVDKSMSM